MHSFMRTCNRLSWGECLVAKIPHFNHFSYTIFHLIPILSFHKTINLHHFHNTYGFILPFSKLFVLSILKRILDSILEINIFFIYISNICVSFVMQGYLKLSTKEYSKASRMFSPSFQDLKEIFQANFKERIMEIWREYLIPYLLEDLKG